MAYSSHSLSSPKSEKVAKISRLGEIFLRYGSTVGIGWIAAMKVTDYEEKVIEPFIAHSPFPPDFFKELDPTIERCAISCSN